MSESTDSGTQELSPYEAANMLEGMFDDDETALPENDDELPEGDDEGEQDDDQDEDDESEQKQPTGELIEVKVNGETEKVTLDELKHGYMKDAYFRQLTAEVQSERREIVQEKAQTAEIGQQLNSLIEMYQNALQSVFSIAKPDPAQLFRQDPTGQLYAEQMQAYETLVAETQRASGIKENVTQLTQEQIARAEQMQMEQTYKEVLRSIPEWGANRELATKEITDIGQYARSVGYDNDQLKRLSASDLVVFRDAMKWRALQDKKPEVDKKTKQLPPVKSGKMNGKVSTAADRLKKTGSKKDAYAAVMNLL